MSPVVRRALLVLCGTTLTGCQPKPTAPSFPISKWTLQPLPGQWKATNFKKDADLSGLTTPPGAARGLMCSDELKGVQTASLDYTARTINGGDLIRLLPDDAPTEADLEGVAWMPGENAYYLIGSHGVSKKKAEAQPTRSHIFKVPATPDGCPTAASPTTGSLNPWIAKNATLAPYIGRSLQENGINIEGLAAKDGSLWIGLRSPNLSGQAFIIQVTQPATVFTAAPEAKLHTLSLGAPLGIRELAALRTGFLLLLGNATPDDATPTRISYLAHWDPSASQPLHLIGTVPPSSGKPEALHILTETDSEITLLILSDGVSAGDPITLKITK